MTTIKKDLGLPIRIGSKTLVEVSTEPLNPTFEAGTGYFKIIIGDKKIHCYAEPGALEALEEGKKVRIPKRVIVQKK
jgi:hypothetical protein